MAEEAADNDKFLGTLEQQLRVIKGTQEQHSSVSLRAIADVVEPLMTSLRLLWALSRRFSDDRRMCALMQGIARSIGRFFTSDAHPNPN